MTAETGLTWTDEDVTLRRPADMPETQWVIVRDAFLTFCQAEGLQRVGHDVSVVVQPRRRCAHQGQV